MSTASVVVINAGCRAGTNDALLALLTHCAEHVSALWAVHVTELDAHRTTDLQRQVEGWRVWRHWPGEGSRAMAWCIRRSALHQVVSVSSCGRAQAVVLRISAGSAGRVIVVGHHAPHEPEALPSHLADLACLVGARRGPSRWVIAGDANADLLWRLSASQIPGALVSPPPPRFEGDCSDAYAAGDAVADTPPAEPPPQPDVPGPPRHRERCAMYRSFARNMQGVVLQPEVSDGVGGSWAAACALHPFTRLPHPSESARLACLDWAMHSSPGQQWVQSDVCWRLCWSDHAGLVVRLASTPQRRRAGLWRPSWDEAFEEAVRGALQSSDGGFTSVHDRLREAMDAHADSRSAGRRRYARVPFAARRSFRMAAAAQEESWRQWHLRLARELLTQASAERRRAAVRRTAARRGNVAPVSVLRGISALRTSDGDHVVDTERIGERILSHFAAKWRCADADAHERVDVLLAGLGDAAPQWTESDLETASSALRHADRVDSSGVCVGVLRVAARVAPTAVLAAVSELAVRGAAPLRLAVRAVALGKKSASPLVTKVRMLLPMGAWLSLVDALIASSVHRLLDSLPPVPGFWEGATAGVESSASYLSHWARLVVEKGLDWGSRGAMLFTDIRTFYDCVDVTTSVMAAVAHGLPREVGAAAVRHQLFTQIDVTVSDIHVGSISRRGIGAMTGSRVAGALGRVVVRSLAEHLHRVRGHSAVRFFDDTPMLVAAYVDNLLLLGEDASVAEATYTVAVDFLRGAWALELPAGETEVLAPRASSVRPARLRGVERAPFLGHVIDSNASCLPCWRRARDQVVARCAAQMRTARRARVPVEARVASLDAILWPALAFRAPSWAPTRQVLTEADALQRRCAALALRTAPYPFEDPAAYNRRRGRAAAVALASVPSWSQRILQCASDRLRALRSEPRGGRSWLGAVVASFDAAWLSQRRVEQGSSSSACWASAHTRGPRACVPAMGRDHRCGCARAAARGRVAECSIRTGP